MQEQENMENNENNEKYDVVIIWSGSAWLPAWMYAARYKLKTLVIWAQPGWALATSHRVENYPWILSAPGWEIMQKFEEHAKAAWSEVMLSQVSEISWENLDFTLKLSNSTEINSKKIILATGNNYKKLMVPWEKELMWKWVSYCATCDWMFFRNKTVAIVGGWNTAITEALYLSEICEKVYILVRSVIRAEDIWIDKVKNRDNIEIIYEVTVDEIVWKMMVEWVKLNTWEVISVNWVFVAVWSIPNTWLVEEFSPMRDEDWCLVVDSRQETSVKWLYAAGDVTTNSNKFKQTIMSAAEGSLAANSVHEDLLD